MWTCIMILCFFGVTNKLRKALGKRASFALLNIPSSFRWVRKVECLVWRALRGMRRRDSVTACLGMRELLIGYVGSLLYDHTSNQVVPGSSKI